MFDIDSVMSGVHIMSALINIAVYLATRQHSSVLNDVQDVLETVAQKMDGLDPKQNQNLK